MTSAGNVVPLARYRPTAEAPLFIFVDLQNEFRLRGRPLYIEHVEQALQNCCTLLALARDCRFPIAHVRLTRRHVAFHERAKGAAWIPDFRPYGSEMVFERDLPSCYGSADFMAMMDAGGGKASILAGLAGSTSCLATLIEAHGRGHHLQYAFDASSSVGFGRKGERLMHAATTRLASQFVALTRTADVVRQFSTAGNEGAIWHDEGGGPPFRDGPDTRNDHAY